MCVAQRKQINKRRQATSQLEMDSHLIRDVQGNFASFINAYDVQMTWALALL